MRSSGSSGELRRLWNDPIDRPLEDGEPCSDACREPLPQQRHTRQRPRLAALAAALLLAVLLLAALVVHDEHSRTWLAGTIEEFARQAKGALRIARPGAGGSYGRGLLPWREARSRAERAVDKLTTQELHGLLHGIWTQGPGHYIGNIDPIPSMNVPPLKMQDASSGFRTLNPHVRGSTTQWPCLLALASTWDESIVGNVASAIAREFLGKGANVLLGPSVNVHRTAYGGRNFEYLSGEDPHLGSRLTKAYIKSLQDEGVMAVVKHFAFNEQETARGHESSNVDDRTAWELYYPPFEAAVEAGASAVMCSYNQVNGTSACENEGLLVRDLKGRMGFQGFVMSDWTATHSTAALEVGLDMEQPHGLWFSDHKLTQNVPSGAVRDAAVRVLSSIFRMRLDENPGCVPPCYHELLSDQRSEAHMQLARDAATESVTLLKNNGVLPLDPRKVRKLAVLGRAADAEDVMKEWSASPYAGGGSGHVLAPRVVSPLAAIGERAEAAGVEVLNETSGNLTTAAAVALLADVVLVVASALSTEGHDRKTLALAWEADELISAVAKLRPTVVLLQSPGAVLTPWRNETAAVANLFYGGEQTGRAWAAVLFGDHSPTGRLPIMFPATEEDAIEPGWATPPFKYYPVPYTEGRLTSYRSRTLQSAFPFGHGLTYTRFSFSRPIVRMGGSCPEAACLNVNISNIGDRAGREVAQAYLQFAGGASDPRFVLRGFQKTRLLLPGETQEVLLAFTSRDLSTYSVSTGWERSFGVRVLLGASSADVRQVVDLPISGAARSVQTTLRLVVVFSLALLRHWWILA